jgi:hypothetical protein
MPSKNGEENDDEEEEDSEVDEMFDNLDLKTPEDDDEFDSDGDLYAWRQGRESSNGCEASKESEKLVNSFDEEINYAFSIRNSLVGRTSQTNKRRKLYISIQSHLVRWRPVKVKNWHRSKYCLILVRQAVSYTRNMQKNCE